MQNTTKSNEKCFLKQNYFWKYTENISSHIFLTQSMPKVHIILATCLSKLIKAKFFFFFYNL